MLGKPACAPGARLAARVRATSSWTPATRFCHGGWALGCPAAEEHGGHDGKMPSPADLKNYQRGSRLRGLTLAPGPRPGHSSEQCSASVWCRGETNVTAAPCYSETSQRMLRSATSLLCHLSMKQRSATAVPGGAPLRHARGGVHPGHGFLRCYAVKHVASARHRGEIHASAALARSWDGRSAGPNG